MVATVDKRMACRLLVRAIARECEPVLFSSANTVAR